MATQLGRFSKKKAENVSVADAITLAVRTSEFIKREQVVKDFSTPAKGNYITLYTYNPLGATNSRLVPESPTLAKEFNSMSYIHIVDREKKIANKTERSSIKKTIGIDSLERVDSLNGAQTSKIPLENGSFVVDHYIKNPKRLEMTVVLEDKKVKEVIDLLESGDEVVLYIHRWRDISDISVYKDMILVSANFAGERALGYSTRMILTFEEIKTFDFNRSSLNVKYEEAKNLTNATKDVAETFSLEKVGFVEGFVNYIKSFGN